VDHTLPDIHSSVDTRGDGTLDIAQRIVSEHLVISDMHANRGQDSEAAEQRRGMRVRRIVSTEIRFN
jgi:hypothetical protein